MNPSPSSVDSAAKAAGATTPMLKQYHELKAKHQNCILFFRLGDFYEMFYDDAKVASKALDLVLTARGKAPSQKIPMCGIPHHAAENYIARLIKEGHKVAICEQVEDPAQAKGIVKRDVTRIITKGTYLDENSTAARYIVAVSPGAKVTGLAFVDPTAGTIWTNQYGNDSKTLVEILATLPVQECIFPDASEEYSRRLFDNPLLRSQGIVESPFEGWCFNPDLTRKTLLEHFKVHNLAGFGIEEKPAAVSSCGALLEYMRQMNKQPVEHIDRIAIYAEDEYVHISPAAHRGLEFATLIRTVDETQTAMGRRRFYDWFYHPLKDKTRIEERQTAIDFLKTDPERTAALKALLQRIPDLEKNISRLSCGYTHPKDILAVRNTLALLPELRALLEPIRKQSHYFALDDIPQLRERLISTVNADFPLAKYEGKVICSGYHPGLDELRALQENGRSWLKDYQVREAERSGIGSLKIGYNKVFGYYIEITKANVKLAPQDYHRKQTLTNAERYITPELKEYEEKILTAQDKIVKIENEIIAELQRAILDESLALHEFCRALSQIDALYSLAVLAASQGYIKPNITDDTVIAIADGRHPVVERTTVDTFIANDTLLDSEENQLLILTGPNMSGKSTYIRQTALLVIMAQVGSYIPAKSAAVGLVDKVFTRIGAHDDISRGQSTFMVEMNETADILNNMTPRSLVILDEIGRGTSTYDGLSLAWALAEHLTNTATRTLFATHFHELTALAERESCVKNYNVAVKEWKDEIIFMHKIVPGSSDDSYGIYVAKLAGIPDKIIKHARRILTQLELKKDLKRDIKHNFQTEDQLSLFNGNGGGSDPVLEELREEIRKIELDKLTPLDALNRLAKLKDKYA